MVPLHLHGLMKCPSLLSPRQIRQESIALSPVIDVNYSRHHAIFQIFLRSRMIAQNQNLKRYLIDSIVEKSTMRVWPSG